MCNGDLIDLLEVIEIQPPQLRQSRQEGERGMGQSIAMRQHHRLQPDAVFDEGDHCVISDVGEPREIDFCDM